MSDAIKSVTNCPTCGVECKIGNGDSNSHYYIPNNGITIQQVNEYMVDMFCTKIIPTPNFDSNSIAESINKYFVM